MRMDSLRAGISLLWRRMALAFVLVLLSAPVFARDIQTGDLIFQISQNRQSLAIEEAQGSPYTHVGVIVEEPRGWYVYEAIQPVTRTPLARWVSRGYANHFVIKRIHENILDMSRPENQTALVNELNKYMGRNYDIFFEWGDERIYCSELAYKGYLRSLGLPVGQIQRTGDLNLEGPNIKKLIAERERMKGTPIDLEEPIITPVSMMEAEVVYEVGRGMIINHWPLTYQYIRTPLLETR